MIYFFSSLIMPLAHSSWSDQNGTKTNNKEPHTITYCRELTSVFQQPILNGSGVLETHEINL